MAYRKSLKMYLDLKSAYGTFEGGEDEFCCRIVGAVRKEEREITIQLSEKKSGAFRRYK